MFTCQPAKSWKNPHRPLPPFSNPLFLSLLALTLITSRGFARELKLEGEFDEAKFVDTKKNPLIRRRISLLAVDVGEPAEHGGPCNVAMYREFVKPIYAGCYTPNCQLSMSGSGSSGSGRQAQPPPTPSTPPTPGPPITTTTTTTTTSTSTSTSTTTTSTTTTSTSSSSTSSSSTTTTTPATTTTTIGPMTTTTEGPPKKGLSIYERSDLLFRWIVMLENDVARNGYKNSTLRKDTCGANHLMYCSEVGTCQCMGEAPSTYPLYQTMTLTKYGEDPNGKSISECRVAEGGFCNPKGLLFCGKKGDTPLQCDNANKKKDPEAGVRNCKCALPRRGGFYNITYINEDPRQKDPPEAAKANVFKVPIDHCTVKPMNRPRKFQ